METLQPKSKVLSTLFDKPSVLSILVDQSNSLAQLTGESCTMGRKLNNALLVCNTQLLIEAFSTILRGINQNVSLTYMDTLEYITLIQDRKDTVYDTFIIILQNQSELKKAIDTLSLNNDSTAKNIIVAPKSFNVSASNNIDAAISLESDAHNIRNALLRALNGEKFTSGFAEKKQNKYSHLTPRQKDVLKYICNGQSNKEIARELNISLSTIKVHCAAIFRELGVTNRTQAALVLSEY